MELLGLLVPLVECVSPHVAKRWEYHRDFGKNKDALGEALAKLNDRKTDIEITLDGMVLSGVTEAGCEVSGWLQRVAKISREFEDIEKEVRYAKFFSRASLGRKIAEKKLEVEALYEEGVFPEGTMIKTLPRRGESIPTPDTRGQTTFQKIVEDIWGCFLDDKVTKIGIYGMGGVGKTTVAEHINNRLLEHKEKFDKVIWVTVSNNFKINELQNKLAHKLEVDLSKVEDEESRAEKLLQGFVKSKMYVLILDDVWNAKHDTFKKVGIPDPAPANGCKLLLTTRSLEVCRKICCDAEIPMNLLSEEEALELFFEKVGRSVSSNPKLEKLVKQVARECARLPLAITVIAGSLRRKTDPYEWEVALTDLKGSTAPISEEVMKNLRMSYDWLNDEKLRNCLLYCALYPEDCLIERSLLVDQLMADGIVGDDETSRYQIGKCQVMLNELVSVCLLSDALDEEGQRSLKMHDLVRDMAIQIMGQTPSRFLIQAGKELSSLPCEKSWDVDLEKVSLMKNNIAEISSSTKPINSPKISTLFLNSNPILTSIPNNFFLHMKRLSVLNLSHTGIRDLPESISDLVNLAVLLLRGCFKLRHMHSVAKLVNMKRLDLCGTGITEIPEGLEMLIKLTYLNLSYTCLKFIPVGIFCKLIDLCYLSVELALSGHELANLQKLETFEGALDFPSYIVFLQSIEDGDRGLANMRVVVGTNIPWFWHRTPTHKKTIYFHKCNIGGCESVKGGFSLLFPKNVEDLGFDSCKVNASSLCQLVPLKYASSLRRLSIISCDDLECVLFYSPSLILLLQRIEELELIGLPNLRTLFSTEKASSSLPQVSFSSLTKLTLRDCNKVKTLFDMRNHLLPNLIEIYIDRCSELEEILSSDYASVTEPTSFSKLRIIELRFLPKLRFIGIEIPSSNSRVSVVECPKLNSIPFLDREPYLPIQFLYIDQVTWESLQWVHPNAKANANAASRKGSLWEMLRMQSAARRFIAEAE